MTACHFIILTERIYIDGTVNRQPGNGRPRSAQTDENIEAVDDLVLSQEDKHKTTDRRAKFHVKLPFTVPVSIGSHRAHHTIQLLQRETPDFVGPDIWPPNSPDLNPVDYKNWGVSLTWLSASGGSD